MSSNFTYLGQAYEHMLNLLGGAPIDHTLYSRGTFSSNVISNLATVVPQAGCVVHTVAANAPSQPFTGRGPKLLSFELGCAGTNQRPPHWLWRGLYDYDVTNKGTSGTTAAAGVGGSPGTPPAWYSVFPSSDPSSAVVAAVVGIQGLEVETTEFDTDQTYAAGQFLRAVTSNSNANAGKVTNQDASGGVGFATSAALTFGTDTCVGVVSRGTYVHPSNKTVLSLYTYFHPGTR